jgi:hypothetical protein
MFSVSENDRLVVERFLGEAGKREPADIDEFLLALENIAIVMGNYISGKTSPLLGGRPFVIGVGADFQEFSVPLIRGMGAGQRARVGCVWPCPSIVKAGQEPLIFFNQEYVENDHSPSDAIVVSQSVVSDKHQVEAVIERAMELKHGLPVIVMCAVSTQEAAKGIQSLFPKVVSMVSSISFNADEVGLNYWQLETLLDRRERKFMPRLAKCLGDRLEASEEELDRYPWIPQRAHYGWPPAPKAVW